MGGMLILIEVDDLTPPVGRIRCIEADVEPGHPSSGPDELAFMGWLGLLRALSVTMGPEATSLK